MATKTIAGLDAVVDANLDDTALLEVEDSASQSKKATIAQLRAALKGGLLADPVSYAAGSDSSYTTSGTSFGDVDATNVKITFTPLLGAALLEVNLNVQPSATGVTVTFNLRDASGDVAGTAQVGAANGAQVVRVTLRWYLTGLTPLTPVTYKLGWKVNSGNGAIAHGPNNGPIVLTAWNLPS